MRPWSLCGLRSYRAPASEAGSYDAGSKLRAVCADVYKRMFGKDMVFTFTHGGLERGELKAKDP